MQVYPIQLNNQQKLMNDYRMSSQSIMKYFDYGISADDMKQRLDDLATYNHFNRSDLVTVLKELNEKWDAPQSTLININRLEDKKSVVVVGGQQAGLLTGPMYTINKVISVIQYAKQQEEQLNVPVVPLFWIAGEDHDYDEINHIFMPVNQQMKKHKTLQYQFDKRAVSDIPLDKKKTKQWLKIISQELQETEYTKDILSSIDSCIEQSNTFVDFFARLLFQLFTEEGLVLLDSGSHEIRRIESNYFQKLIVKQDEINSEVSSTLQDLKRHDYKIDLNVDKNQSHIFYTVNDERVLLYKTEDGNWIGKNNEIQLTTQELKDIAKNQPELLSNNVVTRPLMQELLLPTLAFIGGAGEISYWSTLKSAFHTLGLVMPPVVPRLSFTYINERIIKLMNKYSLEFQEAINDGLRQKKEAWLEEKIDPPIEDTARDIKATIKEAHKPLRDIAHNMRADLGSMADKNLQYLYRNIDYIENRMINAIKERYQLEINEFEELNNFLHPQDGLQERVWNPIFFINEHGKRFIHQLVKTSLSFDERHFLVLL